MTPQDRRLAVLAAAFVPGSAGKLLRLLSCPEAAGLRPHVQALAAGARAERLAALAAVLSEGTTECRAALRKAAGAERPRAARLLLSLAGSQASATDGPCSPALVRLCRERREAP